MLSRSLSRIAFATIAVVSYRACVFVYILLVCSVVLRWISIADLSMKDILDVHMMCYYFAISLYLLTTILFMPYMIQNTKAFAPQKPVGFHLSRNLSFSTSTSLSSMPICIVVEAGKSALVSFYMCMQVFNIKSP